MIQLLTEILFQFFSLRTAFFAVGCLMVISSIIQLSLISQREWSSLFSRVDRMQEQVSRQAKRLSLTLQDLVSPKETSCSLFGLGEVVAASHDATNNDPSIRKDLVTQVPSQEKVKTQ